MHRRLQIGLLLEVIDDTLDHGFQIMLRLEPDEFSDLLDVRAAPAHVLEARSIGFLIGNELDRGRAARHFTVSPFLACCKSLKSRLSDSRFVVFSERASVVSHEFPG